VAVFLAVSVPYTFYVYQADDWGMLRFLMPGWVFLIMAAADGSVRVFERALPRRAVPIAALALAGIAATGSYVYMQRQGVFRIWIDESKYPAVGAWFSTHTASNAVALASLHSGSIHHYSGRQTLRWDQIPSDRLAATVEAIAERGGSAFLVLDADDERAAFVKRFGRADGVQVELVDRVGLIEVDRLMVQK